MILVDSLTPLQIESERIERGLQYSRTITDRNKRILSECANMRTSLDEGTFVIVAEFRPDMMKALIVGPEDTPYANGLFE
jgi:ubiquitin-protein ligase